jgi:hypothetical protein
VGTFSHVLSGHFQRQSHTTGSSFLMLAPGAESAIVMSNAGQAFSLQSFDADTFIHIQGASSLTVTGFFLNGGSITQTFITDTIGMARTQHRFSNLFIGWFY